MDPLMVTTVENETTMAPLLLIDRKGIIGNAIYEKTHKELLTTLVSSVLPDSEENLIYIPYKRRIPEIPNGSYAMILFVYDAEKDIGEIVKKCIAKAKDDGIPFVFLTDIVHLDEKLVEKIITPYDSSYIIATGEFFGQGDTLLDSYILQAATSRTIKLPFMGLRKTRPVLFDDMIHAVLQTLFGVQKKGRVTYLFPQHEYTDLSVTHMLQKIDPLLHIDFLKDKKKKLQDKRLPVVDGVYFFDTTYSVQEKILDVYKTISAKKIKAVKQDAYVYKEEMKPLLDLGDGNGVSSFGKWGGIIFGYIVLLLLFPLLCIGLADFLATGALHNAQKAFSKGDLDKAQQQVSIAHTGFAFEQIVEQPLLFAMQQGGLSHATDQIEQHTNVLSNASSSLEKLLLAEQTLSQMISGDSKNTAMVDASQSVSLIRIALVSLEDVASFGSGNALMTGIGQFQHGIQVLSGTVGLLPQFFAVDTKHTYLILLQNNLNLRPGGGFVAAYGIVTFDHGVMSNILLHPVSDTDSQLRKHIDPPFMVRRYLGVVHAYLRDSSADADFVVDAKQASTLYQTATGQHVDGVISVDASFIDTLLSLSGPIHVVGQATPVSSANFLSLLAEQSHNSADPKADQGNAFFHNVVLALQNTLQSAPSLNSQSLLLDMTKGLEEKHILLALSNITEQNILTANGLSSSLWDSRQDTQNMISDYIGVSEANVSAISFDKTIQRKLKQAISIDGNGIMKGDLHVTYTNKSREGYKNYLQVILPKDTVLTGISFNGQPQATRSAITDALLYESKGFHAPSELEVAQSIESNKLVYGFPVIAPAGQTTAIDVFYEHNQRINIGNPVLHYSLYIYKQPGTDADPYAFSFNFPLEYSILSASPANQDGSSDYTVDMPLSTDKVIDVQLTKK